MYQGVSCLAKVDVESSNLFTRSIFSKEDRQFTGGLFLVNCVKRFEPSFIKKVRAERSEPARAQGRESLYLFRFSNSKKGLLWLGLNFYSEKRSSRIARGFLMKLAVRDQWVVSSRAVT